MPRVSVITPAYDNAATIEATMASVGAQDYADWEHVVCDDVSPDDTADRVLAAAARDPRIRLVRSQANAGPAVARNRALAEATGELVVFLDADDRLDPRYLTTMVGRYDAEPAGVGIVCCDAWREAPDGRRLGRYAQLHGAPGAVGLTDILRKNQILIASLCPRAAVDEAGGFSPECWGSEDHDLWLRILEAGHRVVYVDEPLVTYRVAEGSISSSRLRMARTDQATFRRALERGRLDREQSAIARDRLALARAAEAVARGPRPADVLLVPAAVRARVRLRRAAARAA
jgi:glycosyltransferase involved in cell wall biosynthesis